MGVVEIAIVEPNTPVERHRILVELLEQMGIKSFNSEHLKRNDFGKPYLALDEPLIGYSFSNARFAGGSFGVIALVEGAEIGVDVEFWPRRPSDKVFLETVAAPEDEAVLRILGTQGYDAGLALWVIKEAALKCSGDVMVDPHQLAVSQSRNNELQVGPSSAAGAPVPEFRVALFELRADKCPEHLFLCGIAVTKHFGNTLKAAKNIASHRNEWFLSRLL